MVAGVGFLLEGPKARSPCLDRSQRRHGLSRDRYPYAERTLLVLSPESCLLPFITQIPTGVILSGPWGDPA